MVDMLGVLVLRELGVPQGDTHQQNRSANIQAKLVRPHLDQVPLAEVAAAPSPIGVCSTHSAVDQVSASTSSTTWKVLRDLSAS